ncbi:hypothetical protein D3C87_323430 [compost metagenome]
MNNYGMYIEGPKGEIDESLQEVAENLISVLGQQAENLSKVIDYLSKVSEPGVINISGCSVDMGNPDLSRYRPAAY